MERHTFCLSHKLFFSHFALNDSMGDAILFMSQRYTTVSRWFILWMFVSGLCLWNSASVVGYESNALEKEEHKMTGWENGRFFYLWYHVNGIFLRTNKLYNSYFGDFNIPQKRSETTAKMFTKHFVLQIFNNCVIYDLILFVIHTPGYSAIAHEILIVARVHEMFNFYHKFIRVTGYNSQWSNHDVNIMYICPRKKRIFFFMSKIFSWFSAKIKTNRL